MGWEFDFICTVHPESFDFVDKAAYTQCTRLKFSGVSEKIGSGNRGLNGLFFFNQK
jgi:hypothetical protein